MVAGELSGGGDKNSVVEKNGEKDGEADDALKRGGRDLKVGADGAEHGGALLCEESVDLSLYHCKH